MRTLNFSADIATRSSKVKKLSWVMKGCTLERGLLLARFVPLASHYFTALASTWRVCTRLLAIKEGKLVGRGKRNKIMLQHNIEQRFKIYSSNVFSTYVSDCRDVWSWAFGCLLRVLFRLRYDTWVLLEYSYMIASDSEMASRQTQWPILLAVANYEFPFKEFHEVVS